MDQQAHDQCDAQDPQQHGAAPPPVWSLLDRSDPAWRRLYGLYSADASHGKASGLAFSQANRQALQRKVAARAAHSAAAAAAQVAAEQQQKQDGRASASKKTRRVAVPRFHKPRAAEGVADPLAAVPRRRSCAVIAADMAQDAERAWGQVPLPSGPLIDEQEKQRCALLMQFKGAMPHSAAAGGALTAAGQAKVAALQRRAVAPRGGGQHACGTHSALQAAAAAALAARRDALQQRFQEAEHELAEREAFVAGMRGLQGRLAPPQLQAMRAEASAKVAEMRQLDGQIRALDAQLQAAFLASQ